VSNTCVCQCFVAIDLRVFNLHFFFLEQQVKEAGHMVPMDQPKAALQMLQDWMQGKLIRTKGGDNVSSI